ncbi:MAG: tRNA epoxyqueuosine(34) reductase QueG [Firmicutes bacterium]|nr:tRNA epoxyqueuosine(34) reductase QueG [Bacillota bacterium]
MKTLLKEFCRSINLEYVGIAPAGPYLAFARLWWQQVARNHHSGFEERNFAKRVYPHLTMPEAKSVIVCLFPYFAGTDPEANLAKYAYSIDYHLLVKEKLEVIASFLREEIPGFQYQIFVDNGPFSDRHLAFQAGLGFWGINNQLICDKYGSYFFIGTILNNYPFPPDSPQKKTCLQCGQCIQACPGQCILGDFTINARRCKSYLTQKKGQLSAEELEIMQKTPLIWGCDVCQDVCPHNQNVAQTKLLEFTTNLITRLDGQELKRLSNKEFKEKYKNRSFSWRGKKILLRNLEIVGH